MYTGYISPGYISPGYISPRVHITPGTYPSSSTPAGLQSSASLQACSPRPACRPAELSNPSIIPIKSALIRQNRQFRHFRRKQPFPSIPVISVKTPLFPPRNSREYPGVTLNYRHFPSIPVISRQKCPSNPYTLLRTALLTPPARSQGAFGHPQLGWPPARSQGGIAQFPGNGPKPPCERAGVLHPTGLAARSQGGFGHFPGNGLKPPCERAGSPHTGTGFEAPPHAHRGL